MKKMITLYADDGKYITNGEIVGKTISLSDSMTESGFYEITAEEYQKIMDEKNNEYDLTGLE